jgi:hypothetical protein
MMRPQARPVVRTLARSDENFVGGFGCQPPVTQETLYSAPKQPKAKGKKGRKAMSMSGGGTGSVTTKRELGVIVTDYFDYTTEDPTAGGVPQFVTNYYWDIGQNLFDNSNAAPGGQDFTFCRVRRVDVWVLPTCRSFNASNAPNNAQSAFTVNCQTPGMGQQFNATNPQVNVAYATDTQVTNVLPRIDTKWKKVFSCDLQKTFQSGAIRPVFVPSLPTNQCVFQMSIVDQTDGKPYLTGDDQPPIRVKVQLTLDQPISTRQNASLAVWRNEEFALPYVEQNGVAYPGTSDQYVQLDLKSVRDNMR